MSHTLILSLPDEVYEPLRTRAECAQRAPEEVAADLLAEAVRAESDDPLLKLAGSFASDLKDVPTRHDEYLGQALFAELRGQVNG